MLFRSISERPIAAHRRSRRGHWEGDTVMGSDLRHCVLTLVERKTGFVIIMKLKARSMEQARRALLRAIARHPGMFKTITFDNGTEFHDYKAVERVHPLKCYFATPYHSWERGSNENMNGLIRQYLPKGSCMRRITQADCDRIACRLNSRPRKRYGFKTPNQLFFNPRGVALDVRTQAEACLDLAGLAPGLARELAALYHLRHCSCATPGIRSRWVTLQHRSTCSSATRY